MRVRTGFDEVIAKPCLLEELLAGVEQFLASPRIQSS
jgi:DNA-binding response OmpR family regulator